jgi:uncharacterized protein YkwD
MSTFLSDVSRSAAGRRAGRARVRAASRQVRPRAGQKTPEIGVAERQVVERTNAFRREMGQEELPVNAALTRAARYFADYMARTDQYGHEADGATPSERAANHGYDFCIVSENIGYQFHSAGFSTDELAASMVTGWKNSPSHRAAMLDADVTETGVALARSTRTGRYYGVQMFGRPRSESLRFEVANRAGAPVRYRLDGRDFTLDPRSTRTHEQCRAAELEFETSDARPVRVQPAGGERYAVVRDADGRLTLRVD